MFRWFFGKLRRKPVAVEPIRPRNAYCSFCCRSHTEGPLVEGPNLVFICEDCVAMCGKIFADTRAQRGGGQEPPPVPEPPGG